MAVQISGNDITVPRDGSFTRNVTIGGTLTYEDVTNIDSVGLITARTGIEIGARPGVAASISVDGNMVVSGLSTFSSDVIFNADARIVDSIIHEGDTNTKIRFPAADTITAETGGSERVRLGSSGEVYFGTSNWPTGSIGKAASRVMMGNEGSLTIWNETNSAGGGGTLKLACKEGSDATRVGFVNLVGGTENTSDRSSFFKIQVSNSSGSGIERLRVNSSGQLLSGVTGNAGASDANAVFGGGGNAGTNNYGKLYITQSTSNPSSGTAIGFIGFSNQDLDNKPFAFIGVYADADHGTNDYPSRFSFHTTADGASSASERLRINSEGQIQKRQDPVNRTSLKTYSGEGIWIDHYQLQDSGTYRRYADIASGGDGNHGSLIRFHTMPDGGGSPTERLRITHTGYLTNSGTITVPSSGSAWGFTQDQLYLSTAGTSANYALRFYNDNGLVGSALVNGSSVTYNTSSDYRLKENQVSISDAISKVKQLKPYTFNFKSDSTTKIDGFFAHEAQEVVPHAVSGEKDDEQMQSMDYGKLTPLLTAALQESISEIETLKTEVAALKSQLNN